MYSGVRGALRQRHLAEPSTRLPAGLLLVVLCLSMFTAVLVRWFGGSFGFFSAGMWFGKNTNVPPNALAYAKIILWLKFNSLFVGAIASFNEFSFVSLL